VLPSHRANAPTPSCKPAQPKMATAIFGFGQTHAPFRAEGLDQKNAIVGKIRGKAATATNKHIATIAALPSFENNC